MTLTTKQFHFAPSSYFWNAQLVGQVKIERLRWVRRPFDDTDRFDYAGEAAMYASGDVHVSIRPRSNVTAGGVFAESASLQLMPKYGRVWHVVWCRLELVGGNQICKILANASNFGNIRQPSGNITLKFSTVSSTFGGIIVQKFRQILK